MAFHIYRRTARESAVVYERIKPLKLSGASGPIAKHVKTLDDDALRQWRLGPAELLTLAEPALAGPDLTVLFDVSIPGASVVSLYEVRQICGSCRDSSTDIALDLAILVDRDLGAGAAEFAQKFEIPAGQKLRRFSETLSLSGGPGGGDWKWGAPKMQLGATVV